MKRPRTVANRALFVRPGDNRSRPMVVFARSAVKLWGCLCTRALVDEVGTLPLERAKLADFVVGAKGTAYNVSGDRGIQIELINGAKILVGSGNAENLAAAINLVIGH